MSKENPDKDKKKELSDTEMDMVMLLNVAGTGDIRHKDDIKKK